MKTTLTALTLVVGLWAAGPAAAGPVTTPAGLNPGDQFRVLFVSSAKRDATSVNIADYDTFVANLASAAGLTYNGASLTWHALVSTPTVEANSSARLRCPRLHPGCTDWTASKSRTAQQTSGTGALMLPST